MCESGCAVGLRRVGLMRGCGGVTPGKRIRRRQVRIETSGQLGLFGEPAPPQCKPQGGVERALRFVEADASRIMLGGVRLDEHLKAMSIGWPFTVARLLGEQDWAPFLAKLRPNGRPPYAPRAMVGLVVAGILKGVNTLRALEELARSDLAVMWVTGGICPDHSVIGRFLLLHAETLSDSFFAGLTGSVLKATGSEVAMLGLDGTVIAAAVARLGTLKAEALAAALAEAEAKAAEAKAAAEASATDREKAETAAAKAARKVEKLAGAQVVLNERIAARTDKGKDAKGLSIHPDEPEAVVQPQKDKRTYAPSYKPVVQANRARVVVAGDVHPSCETAPVERLVEAALAHGQVGSLLADSGFNGGDDRGCGQARHRAAGAGGTHAAGRDRDLQAVGQADPERGIQLRGGQRQLPLSGRAQPAPARCVQPIHCLRRSAVRRLPDARAARRGRRVGRSSATPATRPRRRCGQPLRTRPGGRATTSARAWSSRCSPTSRRTRACAASAAAAWPRCAWSSCCIWPPTTCRGQWWRLRGRAEPFLAAFWLPPCDALPPLNPRCARIRAAF